MAFSCSKKFFIISQLRAHHGHVAAPHCKGEGKLEHRRAIFYKLEISSFLYICGGDVRPSLKISLFFVSIIAWLIRIDWGPMLLVICPLIRAFVVRTIAGRPSKWGKNPGMV
jgi:hypothetical protein